MNPDVFRPQNSYYCELSGQHVPQRDFPENNSSSRVNSQLKTTRSNKLNVEKKKKKESMWVKAKRKLFSPIIDWCKGLPIRVAPKRDNRKPVLEFCGLEETRSEHQQETETLKFPNQKNDQSVFSSPLSGRSYSLKTSDVSTTFRKLNDTVCAPLAVSTGYTDLLEDICNATAFDVNAKKIKLRLLKSFMENDAAAEEARPKIIEKQLLTKLEDLETKLEDLLRSCDNRKQNATCGSCQKAPAFEAEPALPTTNEVENQDPNFICHNLPAFTSSISDTYALRKYLENETIENTSCPSLAATDP